MAGEIKSFKDLIAWQKGHGLVLLTYKLTDLFPEKEVFALSNQMRRAVVSITSNIAEGFCRQSAKEKIHFYYIAMGSNTELQNQLFIAKDLEYLNQDGFDRASLLSVEVEKLLHGLIKSQKLIA